MLSKKSLVLALDLRKIGFLWLFSAPSLFSIPPYIAPKELEVLFQRDCFLVQTITSVVRT